MSLERQYPGKLFVFSGPSGAGKGTICKELLAKSDEGKVVLSVSMTTREAREGEEHGREYYFVSEADFEESIRQDGFLEYANVYGNYYGTPKQLVLDKLEKGTDVILEIDIQGAMNIKKAYPQAVFIFILPPSMHELRKRITGRGTETSEVIDMRLSKTLSEIAYIDKYDYVVVNGELSEAVARVQSILIAEHSKVSEDVYRLIEKYKEEI